MHFHFRDLPVPQAVPLVVSFILLAVLSELITWVWVYNKPSFRAAKVGIQLISVFLQASAHSTTFTGGCTQAWQGCRAPASWQAQGGQD